MNTKPVMGILAALVLFASVGAAMALWSDSLRINTTIETGEVRVDFDSWYCNDTGADPQAQGFDNSEGKDVAQCIVEPEIFDERESVIKLNVTIVNAYPGYHAVIYFNVTNTGTIPVKLLNYTMSSFDDTALDAWLVIPEDTQIHAGEEGEYELHIIVLQPAMMDDTYFFEISMTFAQWNEVPPLFT